MSRTGKIYRDRRDSWLPGAEEWEAGGVITKGHCVSLWGDDNIVKLDSANSHTIL